MSAYATILTGSQISCSFSQQGNLELTEEGKALPRHTNKYPCVTIAYSIQYSNMLYRFVA